MSILLPVTFSFLLITLLKRSSRRYDTKFRGKFQAQKNPCRGRGVKSYGLRNFVFAVQDLFLFLSATYTHTLLAQTSADVSSPATDRPFA